jgi:hypothetical protein
MSPIALFYGGYEKQGVGGKALSISLYLGFEFAVLLLAENYTMSLLYIQSFPLSF